MSKETIEKFKEYRNNLSEEDKENLLNMARKARVAKAQQRLANSLLIKTLYLDSGHWAELATKMKIRMPSNHDTVTAGVLRKYMRKAGVSIETFNESYTSTSYFVKNNPDWSAYAAAGLVLELATNEKGD